MSTIHRTLRRTSLPILLVLCLAALSASYAFADEALRPLATQVIGDPDAAVTGKLAVGTGTPGNKALTVVGVIDFLGAGTVHNYFTQGAGNNMQINANVDEANTVGDATKSQWKLVMGSSLDWFSIRRSPAGGTYNEDALFFIEGSTGNVGIMTVDTGNGATIPITPQARLHVQTASGGAIYARSTATTGSLNAVYGQTDSTQGSGVYGSAASSTGANYGVYGVSASTNGKAVHGLASATTGVTYGVSGYSQSSGGAGVFGWTPSTTGGTYGVIGMADSTLGTGVWGYAQATTGPTYGVTGQVRSTSGRGVWGQATATTGSTYGVLGETNSVVGYGVYGYSSATTGPNYGVVGENYSWEGRGVYGRAVSTTGPNFGVYGRSESGTGIGVYGFAPATGGINYGVSGHSNSPVGYGVLGSANATTGTNYGVYGVTYSPSGYGVYFVGGLAGTGAKSAIVETDDYGWRHLYAVESPQNWFEDFGQATLSAGEVVVPIESIFAQTVNLDEDYLVFLTPSGGGCTLFVAERSSTTFTVRANEGTSCEISFDYRIIAPRLDYEDLRLKEAEAPEQVALAIEEPPPAPDLP